MDLTDRLRDALQALAAPADVQLTRYGERAHVPDSLALEFAEALDASVDALDTTMTPEQTVALSSVDDAIRKIMASRGARLWVWSTDAIARRPEWEILRTLAGGALRAFGWPVSPPPPRGG